MGSVGICQLFLVDICLFYRAMFVGKNTSSSINGLMGRWKKKISSVNFFIWMSDVCHYIRNYYKFPYKIDGQCWDLSLLPCNIDGNNASSSINGLMGRWEKIFSSDNFFRWMSDVYHYIWNGKICFLLLVMYTMQWLICTKNTVIKYLKIVGNGISLVFPRMTVIFNI